MGKGLRISKKRNRRNVRRIGKKPSWGWRNARDMSEPMTSSMTMGCGSFFWKNWSVMGMDIMERSRIMSNKDIYRKGLL